MNKKVLKVVFVAAIAMVSGINVFKAQKSEVLSDTVLANVEALADNESTSELDCQGLLGLCSMDCSHCGFSWWAIGSALKGTHKCSQ